MTLQHEELRDTPARQTPPRRERLPAAVVRAYDIRGKAGVDITAANARELGLSYAAAAAARGLSKIGVARDGRLSSPELEAAVVEGLTAGGMAVVRLGLSPTPKLTFAVRTLGLDGGVMVTASHNPSDENGFKLLLGPERISGERLRLLVETQGHPRGGGTVGEATVTEAYVERLLRAAGEARPMKIAWDAGNGATGPTVRMLAERLAGEAVLLNCEIDGDFPGHHPDPAVEANLEQLRMTVRKNGCDLGIAFDGDGDRIGVVDGEGEVIWADQLLLFLAEDLLAEHPGATVVGDVKCSRLLFDGVAALGGRPVLAPSGYVRVREVMRGEGALLAGELSGHIFYGDRWDGTDDALYVAMRLICALSKSGRSLADFRKSLPKTLATPELRIPCPEPVRRRIVPEIAARLRREGATVDAIDGVRVSTPDGWWLLRVSGTEPKLTLRCEADCDGDLARLKAEVAGQLAMSGLPSPFGP